MCLFETRLRKPTAMISMGQSFTGCYKTYVFNIDVINAALIRIIMIGIDVFSIRMLNTHVLSMSMFNVGVNSAPF